MEASSHFLCFRRCGIKGGRSAAAAAAPATSSPASCEAGAEQQPLSRNQAHHTTPLRVLFAPFCRCAAADAWRAGCWAAARPPRLALWHVQAQGQHPQAGIQAGHRAPQKGPGQRRGHPYRRRQPEGRVAHARLARRRRHPCCWRWHNTRGCAPFAALSRGPCHARPRGAPADRPGGSAAGCLAAAGGRWRDREPSQARGPERCACRRHVGRSWLSGFPVLIPGLDGSWAGGARTLQIRPWVGTLRAPSSDSTPCNFL